MDAQTGVVAGFNIYDFENIVQPFSGALTIVPNGAVGLGSPYPVDHVNVDIFDKADSSGFWGNATFVPGVETLKPAFIGWYTIPGLNAFSKASLTQPDLQGNTSISIATNATDSRLRVYYVSLVGWMQTRNIHTDDTS